MRPASEAGWSACRNIGQDHRFAGEAFTGLRGRWRDNVCVEPHPENDRATHQGGAMPGLSLASLAASSVEKGGQNQLPDA